jgi:hypothetical protein
MRRTLAAGAAVLACLSLLGVVITARAVAIRIVDVPVYQRVGNADCIVVGKVTAIAEKPVTATAPLIATQKVEYKIATVKLSETLSGGLKGLTEVKVGFQLPVKVNGPGGPGGGIRPPIRRPPFNPPSLTVGQEALLFLNKHPSEDFYVFAGNFTQGPVNKQNKDKFDKEVKEVKHCLQLLKKPVAGLKAKDASERLLTAFLLLDHYRPYTKPGLTYPPKTKAVDAAQSKLILKVIAEADWTKPDEKTKIFGNALFYRLGVTPNDGWTQPKFVQGQNFNLVMAEAFKEWLKGKGKDFRIQRYVIGKADKTDKKEARGK